VAVKVGDNRVHVLLEDYMKRLASTFCSFALALASAAGYAQKPVQVRVEISAFDG
jgi:hypothetical protein